MGRLKPAPTYLPGNGPAKAGPTYLSGDDVDACRMQKADCAHIIWFCDSMIEARTRERFERQKTVAADPKSDFSICMLHSASSILHYTPFIQGMTWYAARPD